MLETGSSIAIHKVSPQSNGSQYLSLGILELLQLLRFQFLRHFTIPSDRVNVNLQYFVHSMKRTDYAIIRIDSSRP